MEPYVLPRTLYPGEVKVLASLKFTPRGDKIMKPVTFTVEFYSISFLPTPTPSPLPPHPCHGISLYQRAMYFFLLLWFCPCLLLNVLDLSPFCQASLSSKTSFTLFPVWRFLLLFLYSYIWLHIARIFTMAIFLLVVI